VDLKRRIELFRREEKNLKDKLKNCEVKGNENMTEIENLNDKNKHWLELLVTEIDKNESINKENVDLKIQLTNLVNENLVNENDHIKAYKTYEEKIKNLEREKDELVNDIKFIRD
jgi:chromosome segregation ATPase